MVKGNAAKFSTIVTLRIIGFIRTISVSMTQGGTVGAYFNGIRLTAPRKVVKALAFSTTWDINMVVHIEAVAAETNFVIEILKSLAYIIANPGYKLMILPALTGHYL